MKIRPATPDDLPAIASIQGTTSWPPADYLNYDCLVAEVNGRVAGFLVAREVAPLEREVLYIAVDAAQRRSGIARGLMEHALASFPGAWFLEVRETNITARTLYESVGFHDAGRRQEYYRNPVEAAIVMRFFS
jgi:ribosomal-protein-alanine N-acetyltransferase